MVSLTNTKLRIIKKYIEVLIYYLDYTYKIQIWILLHTNKYLNRYNQNWIFMEIIIDRFQHKLLK